MLMCTLSFSQPATISLGEPMLAMGVEVTLSTSIFAASPGGAYFLGGDLTRRNVVGGQVSDNPASEPRHRFRTAIVGSIGPGRPAADHGRRW